MIFANIAARFHAVDETSRDVVGLMNRKVFEMKTSLRDVVSHEDKTSTKGNRVLADSSPRI